MGRDDHIGEVPQRAVYRKRLGGEHVERRATEPASEYRVSQRGLVDHLARATLMTNAPDRQRGDSRGVDELRRVREPCEAAAIDQLLDAGHRPAQPEWAARRAR